MAEIVLNFLQRFIDNDYILTLLVSMFPLIELKGAIPIGAKLGLELYQSAPLAWVGSSLVCIPIFFLLIPVFELLKKIPFLKKFIEKVETVFDEKARKLSKKAGDDAESAVRRIYIISLFIFVAVPFPVTGVWTGTAIAVFLKMKFKDSILPLVLGNMIAGILITLLTFICTSIFHEHAELALDIIIYSLFAIALVMLVVFIVKIFKAKPDNEENQS